MKQLVIPSSLKQIKDCIEYCDGFIVGYKDLSTNMQEFTKEEINEIIFLCQKEDKDIFVALNRNMHHQDLEFLKETLKLLADKNVTGVLYYDIAIVQIVKDNKYDLSLVWAQEHMTTNALSSNYWYNHGAKYTLVSGEITLEEIIEMKKEAKAKLMVMLFGYLPMFASKRHLVENYMKQFCLKDESNIFYIEKEGYQYPIIDSKYGTTTYSSHILNGIREVETLRTNNIDYVIFSSYLIDEEDFLNILKIYYDNSSYEEKAKKIDELLPTDYGFLYKETIYKVKNNE